VVASVGDVNGDGKEDWAISLGNVGVVYVYLNNGSFPSSGLMSVTASSQIYSSNADDYPGTSIAWMTTTGSSTSSIVISSMMVNGVWVVPGASSFPDSIDVAELDPGSFIQLNALDTFNGVDVTSGDVDGDGDRDVLAAGKSSATVLESDGGSLSIAKTLFSDICIGQGSSALLGGDYNLDGRADIAVAGANPSFIALGAADATTVARSVDYAVGVMGTDQMFFAKGDFIDDGADDLITLVDDSNPRIVIRY
jgi:hypothetical protein